MRKTLIALCAVGILGFVKAQHAETTTVPVAPAPPAPVPVPVPVRKANNITVKFDEEAAKNASNSIFRVFKRLSKSAEWAVKNGVEDVYNGIRTAYKNA
jgi:hypothetical protein